MKITSNYNLSFNPKVNNQQSKTNPNFGINAKNLTLPLGIGAGAIYGAVHKLMPLPPAELFLATQIKPASENKNSGLKNLPADKDGYTKLHHWCEDGNFEEIKNFLAENTNINLSQRTKDGNSCMFLAIKYMQKDIIDLIANTGNYKPDIPDKHGWTDFLYLCNTGYTEAVKTLLEKHPEIDFNQQTEDGVTCMSYAIENDNTDIINLIAGKDNYDSTIPDEDGLTDLHRLCENGYTEAVKTLLEKHPEIDFNQQTKDGDTCMSYAIDNEEEEIINLIANTDNYNPAIPDKNGWTDLYYLCNAGYTEAVKTLLEKHPEIDINKKTENGDTCMSLAIDSGREDIIDLIAGRDDYNPGIPNKDGHIKMN